MMKTFSQEQLLNATSDEIWRFISKPVNLEALTPDWLNIRIVSAPVAEIFNGMLIEYQIKLPFLGFQQWVSEIKHVEAGSFFVDEQKIGPYGFWYHAHKLEQLAEKSTRMIDTVSYDVGWGPLGALVERFYVEGNIRKIFSYREKALEQLFNKT